MRKIATLLLLCWVFYLTASAQQRTISGHISSEDGKPVSGATILVKGGKKGTSTDDNGTFTLAVKDNIIAITVSAIGYITQTVPLGGSLTINITLKGSDLSLNQVVVTALGIKREVKTLGYAAQQVSSEQLVQSQQPNLINALQGKVAGVTISSAGGGPGQGASILIRGINSLDPTKDNQPLFVIDGLPVDNSTFRTGTGGQQGYTDAKSY